MKNFVQRICFALSVCLVTACHTHQPLRCNDDEITLQQLAAADDVSGMEALFARVNVNAHCYKHKSALIQAASNGAHNAVNFLLEHGAQPDIQNNYGTTALALARQNNHPSIVTMLE